MDGSKPEKDEGFLRFLEELVAKGALPDLLVGVLEEVLKDDTLHECTNCGKCGRPREKQMSRIVIEYDGAGIDPHIGIHCNTKGPYEIGVAALIAAISHIISDHREDVEVEDIFEALVEALCKKGVLSAAIVRVRPAKGKEPMN